MTPGRILFYKTRKNRNALAALVGSLEVARRLSVVEPSGPREDLPDLRNWSVDFFGPAAAVALPDGSFEGTTVLAYSLMSADVDVVRTELQLLREAQPGWLFIAGGCHPSADPEGTLALGFDHVFVGEGEEALPRFLRRVEHREDNPRILGPGAPIELDRYLSFAPVENLLAPIELSRGCPYGCRFCQTPRVQGHRMRHRSVESVLEHVRLALDRGRHRTWFVTPDAFAYGSADGIRGDRDACERLLKGCRDEGMRELFWGEFPSEVRPDHVGPEYLELVAKYCANRSVLVGFQSGCDDVLRRMGRGHTVAVAMEAIRTIRAFGLVPHVDFMLGLPGETLEQRRMTMSAIEEVTGRHGGRVNVHHYMPLPGTPWAKLPPASVEDEILARLEHLTGQGKAYGFWRQQRRLKPAGIDCDSP